MRMSRRVKRRTKRRRPRTRTIKIKMRGGSDPMSEWGNVFSNLGYLSQSALNMFSVPIPTIVGQMPNSPLVNKQFPLIQPLALD